MRKDDQKLLGGLVLFMLGALMLVGLFENGCEGRGSVALAQIDAPERLSYYERELAKSIARVAFNEALNSEPDLELIAQIVMGVPQSDDDASPPLQAVERLYWLRSHSPCVMGMISDSEAYQRPGNCRWTRNLRTDGRQPRGWIPTRDGRWSWTRRRWQRHLELSIEYVDGTRMADICPETPESWDGRRTTTRERLEAAGWRILDCDEETQNFAVVRATEDPEGDG
jgi:hypothetical protein